METEQTLQDIIGIETTHDKMSAQIICDDQKEFKDLTLSEEQVYEFLRKHKIIYGINETVIKQLVTDTNSIKFPLTIAQGTTPIHGEDGYLTYETETDEQIKVSPDKQVNFRDVIKIPTVKKGEKLATIVEPTKGKNGKNVFGEEIRYQPGKVVTTRAGKNVVYKKENNTFYSAIDGQISMSDHLIEVHPTYVVNETLSMKTGNLDFVGSITIHGDVPTGYQVKAGGDVKIYGIVEAAYVEAGGSVFISEGLAGLQKGEIVAGGDVHLGYINQGHVQTEGSLYVEQSIVHSVCVASEQVICKIGSIIGGSITARQLIEAKDVGNRLSTKTSINFTLPVDYFATKEDRKSVVYG